MAPENGEKEKNKYAYDENRVTYFGETDSRNHRVKFGIKAKDRTRHVYVIGKTGMGKSTLLENMAIQDIQNGEGMAFIDPHGKTAELLLEYVPKDRIKDVVYFAPFDMDYPISFNVMEDVGADKRHLVANGLMSAFKKIWVDAWSARMEYILNNILLALLEYPDSTLIGVNRMLADKDYRKKVVANITDPSVRSFWIDEFAKYGDRYMQEAGAAIQNKIGQFISNPLVRNIIGQPKSTFDLRKVMDDRKILIVNLSKGRVGEANANLLGSMIITKIYLAAMSRADVHESGLRKLPNFYLFVDEFQSFANESFADILSEARKYKLNLTIAHQYIEQMSEEVRAAVFGNVGTMIAFRVGAFDAEVLEKEFAPKFTAEDLVNLGFIQIYLKLMIDGVSSAPFSATTLPPIEKLPEIYVKEIIESSRKTFARLRAVVEEEIRKWHEPSVADREVLAKNEGVKSVRSEGRFEAAKSAIRNIVTSDAGGASARVSVPNDTAKNSPSAKDLKIADALAKEKEQVKTISLESLKREKKDKGPSKENISELKRALSDIVKNSGGASAGQGGGKSENENPAKKEAVVVPAQVAHQEKKDKVEPASTSTPVFSAIKEKDKKPDSSESKTGQPEKREEVPEDVLKKILEGK